MARYRSGKRRRADSTRTWVYWGASGILQPLSEEFLYRSPAAILRGSGSCRVHAQAGRRDAQD